MSPDLWRTSFEGCQKSIDVNLERIAESRYSLTILQTILATVIPKITDELRGLDKVAWYSSAYFMTFGGFQSTWGKFYKYFPLKNYSIVALAIFEAGNLVCALAKTPTTLIVGRAIAGVGGAGITTGSFHDNRIYS